MDELEDTTLGQSNSSEAADRSNTKQKVKNRAEKNGKKTKSKNSKAVNSIEDLPNFSAMNKDVVEYYNKLAEKHNSKSDPESQVGVHYLKPSKVIQSIFKKLNWLRYGTILDNAVVNMNGVPEERFRKKYTQGEIKKGIQLYFKAFKEGNFPKNKAWLPGLKLDGFLYNQQQKSHLITFMYYGINPVNTATDKLKEGDEQIAYDFFRKHFDTYSTLNISDDKIVNLIKEIGKYFRPNVFAELVVESIEQKNIMSKALYYEVRFELDQSKHSPNSFLPGAYTYNALENAYEIAYGKANKFPEYPSL